MQSASVLALLLLLPAAPTGQEQELITPFDGTQLFRNLLSVFKLHPITTIADFANKPANQTVLIVLGDLSCLDPLAQARPGGLKKFVDDGGALLIASDRRDEGRLREFDLSISGKLPRVPQEKEIWQGRPQAELFKDSDDCVLIKYDSSLTHPIFAGCKKGIATNAPSFLQRGPKCPAEPLCNFPRILQQNRNFLFVLEEGEAFAVGSSGKTDSSSRMLFLSGHGVFMNVMLGQRDTDNLTFACNVLRWLSNNKQRKYCLFLEENQVFADFTVPIGEPPLPTARIVNDLLRGLEEENFFNRLLLENVPKRPLLLRAVLLVALIGLTIFGLQRLLQARFHRDKAVPRIKRGD
jgi:hypothetical protein